MDDFFIVFLLMCIVDPHDYREKIKDTQSEDLARGYMYRVA